MIRDADRPALGVILRELRARARLKQSAVADAAGISGSTYCRIERGDTVPERWQLVLISEALGVESQLLINVDLSMGKGFSGSAASSSQVRQAAAK